MTGAGAGGAPEPGAAVPLAGGSPFSRTTLWVIAGLVVVSLAAMVVLTLAGEDVEQEPSNGADSYSASAIGHRGLVKVLRALDIPVVVSQSESAAKAKGGLLIVAEPVITDDDSADRLRKLVAGAERVLVILPKWWTTPSSSHKEWASWVDLVPGADVVAVLAAIGHGAAALHRATEPLASPAEPALEGLPAPSIAHSPQSLREVDLSDPMIIADDDGGLLLGTTRYGSAEVTILADPDPINNAGLDDGQNARFAVGLIDQLRHGGPVVFDEVGHGYTLEPSIWKLMFQWPMVLATVQALICILVVVAATAGRFGPPARVPRAIAAGKDFLIRNTAALLRFGGHDGEALFRYLTTTIAAVRAALHAPRDLPPAAMTQWLERIRVARGGTVPLPELEREVSAASVDPALAKKIPEIAMRIHRWRQEMTHGSVHHP